ncbi:MAG: hypothetical protein K2Y21_01640 [Phycisphaerales bacterium]|nr:hypothetical protein [Phycisphaerales bacterium]
MIALAADASGAVTSNLNGSAQTSSTGAVSQSFSDTLTAALSGLQRSDTFGNAATVDGLLSIPNGRFAIASEARSGGVGSATGSANTGMSVTCVATSATLPIGTPVQVRVSWAAKGRVNAAGSELRNVQDVSQSTLSLQAAVWANEVVIENRSGSQSRRLSLFDQYQVITSGALNPLDDSFSSDVSVLVGQTIRIVGQGSLSGGTFAFAPAATAADQQLSFVWGLTALNPGVTMVLQGEPGQVAPTAEGATPAAATALLPPRPSGSTECVQITTAPMPTSACAGNSAIFSVATATGGALTYQWQIETAPGAWTVLGAGPTALPCGGSASASPPGAPTTTVRVTPCAGVSVYRVRCVVSAPCGGAVSGAARLGLCPADLNCDGVVDDADFQGFAGAYNILDCADPAMAPGCPSDLNRDGFVDDADFTVFAAAYNVLVCE